MNSARAMTPVKTLRTRSSGGLTPLPPEQASKDQIKLESEDCPPIIKTTNLDPMDAPSQDSLQDSDLENQINSGLKKIQELDALLAVKSKIAKDLATDRIKRESTDSPEPSSIEEECRSIAVSSTTRPKVGKEALMQTTKSSVSMTLAGYEVGNFVQRNIVLGKEARYYHAMSLIECNRVENILDNPEFDVDPYDDNQSCMGSDRPQSSLSGFYPDPQQLNRLLEIDRELQKIVPESDWETKSLVWSSTMPSGTSTPLSSVRTPLQVDAVLESLSFELLLNNERLGEIDERLNELKARKIPENVQIDQKQLEWLLSQSILEEKDTQIY